MDKSQQKTLTIFSLTLMKQLKEKLESSIQKGNIMQMGMEMKLKMQKQKLSKLENESTTVDLVGSKKNCIQN